MRKKERLERKKIPVSMKSAYRAQGKGVERGDQSQEKASSTSLSGGTVTTRREKKNEQVLV